MLSKTEIYTHVSIHKLKEIHTATHPARAERIRAGETLDVTEEALLATLAAEEEEDSEGKIDYS